MFLPEQLLTLYQRLFAAYGPQFWWPAETPFEVVIGAVLTQNTSWKNVEKAIANLQQAGLVDLEKIHQLKHDTLAGLIRPSGYFNIKAKRLKNLCDWLVGQGGMDSVERKTSPELRYGLLSVNGIGPETADDILLYAFNRPIFVIDTYTRRLLTKLDLINGDEPYERLRSGFEENLDPVLFNEYHALIVRHAKQKCSVTADCLHCGIERPVR